MNEKCAEIEKLQKVHDSFNIHKNVKEITGNYKKKNSDVLMDDNGNIVVELTSKLKTWKRNIHRNDVRR